jgi:trans-aconitate methyltransferase
MHGASSSVTCRRVSIDGMTTVGDDSYWATYNARQERRPVRPLCLEVLDAAGPGAGRAAIDLGCGAGVETRALLTAGWSVLALDGEPGTRERVLATAEGVQQDRLTIDTIDFRDLRALPAVELVYAGYSLPYIHPGDFARIWGLIRTSLRPGAWFAGNLFGVRDSWAGNPQATFLSEDAARALFEGMEMHMFNELEEEGLADSAPKHWHVFDVIARQRRAPS